MKRVYILLCIWGWCLMVHSTNFVAITEILYDTPYNEDTTRYPHNFGEFVELHNAYEAPADISGWSLQTLSPDQTYYFPSGTIIPQYGYLMVAYGDVSPYGIIDSDMMAEGWTDFHNLYQLSPDFYTVLLQKDLLLPNTPTTLLLKDAMGKTRDSVIYAETAYYNTLYAPNSRNKADGNGASYYSVQRNRIKFSADGCSEFIWFQWGGYFNAYEAHEIDNNSAGGPCRIFSEANILPTQTETDASRLNYVQRITPLVPVSSIDTAVILHTPSSALVQRDYYDALYRPYLSVAYHNTPAKHNTVTLTEYDDYNRPTRQWLPIAVEMSHFTPATFQNNAKQFYAEESKPYTETLYSTAVWDNGTMHSEPVGVRRAGLDMGSRMQAQSSRGNDDNEVRRFRVTSSGDLQCDGYYPAKSLLVLQTKDEDNKSRIIYTTQHGQIIMERQDKNIDTYYVYNDIGQLSYVIPPLAAKRLSTGTYPDSTQILKQYAYVYRYDERGNPIYKRLPGCEPILMVYDRTNSLVLSQDGNQRARGSYWTSYKYDYLRRLIYTAEVNTESNSHQELLNSFRNWYVIERFSTGSMNYPMTNTGYSRAFYHKQPTRLLTVNYYDNYDFLTLLPDSVHRHLTFAPFSGATSPANAKGLLTSTRTYTLDGSGNYSATVYYYDYRGREIQCLSSNHLGGYDVTSTTYSFSDNVVDTWNSQSTANGVQIDEHYHYTYDHANRLLTTTYTYGNETPIVLQSFSYDELGRVRKRNIHDAIDSICFAYNIRNQLTGIRSTGFEEKLYYTTECPNVPPGGLAALCYNGNIAASTWTYGNKTNGYLYYYDKLNRLNRTYSILNGIFGDYYYTEEFYYDEQGNIKTLTRWDDLDVMDYLFFSYDGNQVIKITNNGIGVSNYSCKRYQDANDSGDDFAYDANGNIRYDKDRGIAAIRYNLLNLPDTIQFTNGNQIIHTYDVAGNRLRTSYYTRKVTTTVPLGNTLPVGTTANYYTTHDIFHRNCVYHTRYTTGTDYSIEFVHNSEGYIRYYTEEEHYHFYYIKDHLGNIRETYVHPSANYKECIQRMQYYPSGLPWNTNYVANEQPYKYGGKEFVEMHGLDEYDSHARWYYPALARTTTMDPHSEDYYPISPYAWCGNNFVNAIDPTGRDIWELDSAGNVSSHIQNTDMDAFRMNEKQLSFKYGVITKSSDKNGTISFEFNQPDAAAESFKFFADNSIVEYGLITTTSTSIVQTQHHKKKVNVVQTVCDLSDNGKIINSIVHNHPNGTAPSGFRKDSKKGDKFTYQTITNITGKAIDNYVYLPRSQVLIPFDDKNIYGAIPWYGVFNQYGKYYVLGNWHTRTRVGLIPQ